MDIKQLMIIEDLITSTVIRTVTGWPRHLLFSGPRLWTHRQHRCEHCWRRQCRLDFAAQRGRSRAWRPPVNC